MLASFDVKCPYCNTVNRVTDILSQYANAPKIHLCDIDRGGCDNWFVYRPVITIGVYVAPLGNQLDTPE